MSSSTVVVIVPCAEGSAESALDTADSILHYCSEDCRLVLVDDHSTDGGYERLVSAAGPGWHVLRNRERYGLDGLAVTFASALRFVLDMIDCRLVLKIDSDSLVIRHGLFSEALAYVDEHPDVGTFGVYEHDYNGPRRFSSHRKTIGRELTVMRAVRGRPWWEPTFRLAKGNGYRSGENVSGGGMFVTRSCLERMGDIGALDVPVRSRSMLKEDDVYFSMATLATGYRLGHFGAPEGPLCIEWKDLPYPAMEVWERGYKLVHSLDKGYNTGREANGGMTAREVFRSIRTAERARGCSGTEGWTRGG